MGRKAKLPTGVYDRGGSGLVIRWYGVVETDGRRNPMSKTLHGVRDPVVAAERRAELIRSARAQTQRGEHVRTVGDVIAAWKPRKWGGLEPATQDNYTYLLGHIQKVLVTVDEGSKGTRSAENWAMSGCHSSGAA